MPEIQIVEEEVIDHDLPDADFDAGFAGTTEPTTTPELQDAEPAPAAAEPAPVEPVYAKITEQQLTELLAAATAISEIKADSKTRFDSAFGQLGGLKQKLEQMQSATPAGEQVVATAEDFAELAADYPDFAEKQLTALNKVLGKLKGTGTASPQADIQKMFATQAATVRQEIIDSSLDVAFPDWKEEIKKPAFSEWMNKQPADVQALAASDNVGHAARMLRLYETAKNAPPKPTLPTKPSTRQQQIEAAVNPKGDKGRMPGPTEDDDFSAGFNSGPAGKLT